MHTSYRPSGFVKPTLDVSGRCWIIRSRSGKDYSLTLGLVNWVKVKTRSISKKMLGPILHCEPPHAHSPGVATGTVARRLRIDVHDDNDNA